MPSYEMALIIRKLARPQMVEAVKRTSQIILDRGGVLRSFEHLGQRKLPYRMNKHGEKFSEGTYMMVQFDSPSAILLGLKDELSRDLDVIRPRILRREVEQGRPCEYTECDFGELTEDKRNRLLVYKTDPTLVKKL